MADFRNDEFPEKDLEPTKSELKRRMTVLRRLADELSKLADTDLVGFELPDVLLESIRTARRLKSSNARNRQLRHASKILDKSEEDIVARVDAYFAAKRLKAQSFNETHKKIENWRDRLITDPNDSIQELITAFPDVDRQEIRTLVRLAAKEKQSEKPPIQQRKLFVYLRDQVVG